jgi:plastocyanin
MKKLILPLLLLLPSAAFAEDHVVVQKGRRFTPPEITINRGDTLTFANSDEFIHQMYSSDIFDSDERLPGQSLTEAFNHSGTFEVHCHIHPKMKLLVRVK